MTVLKVEEMSCNHCVGRIHELLEGLKIEHSVDLATKTVTINEDANVDQAVEELDDIGFTATRA